MELFLGILKYGMFSFGIIAVVYYIFTYIKAIREGIETKDDGGLLIIILPGFGVLAILIATLTGGAINGGTGVFWAYVVMGAIALIISVFLIIDTIKNKI
ncbi:hypothetical protein U8V72_22075 [Priestia filamentosa]|uniref:hypothetical protein n=1 Tax=Priestia filamentosa TaxID=1402861 RepID=UPI00397B1702